MRDRTLPTAHLLLHIASQTLLGPPRQAEFLSRFQQRRAGDRRCTLSFKTKASQEVQGQGRGAGGEQSHRPDFTISANSSEIWPSLSPLGSVKDSAEVIA